MDSQLCPHNMRKGLKKYNLADIDIRAIAFPYTSTSMLTTRCVDLEFSLDKHSQVPTWACLTDSNNDSRLA